jgi:Pyruvate/2-oxoacid:ferredoxin oxidoreductase delta subunit
MGLKIKICIGIQPGCSTSNKNNKFWIVWDFFLTASGIDPPVFHTFKWFHMHQNSREKSIYSNALLYYFTGTGNAEKVAEWFAASAEELNCPSRMIHISSSEAKKISAPGKNVLTGFFCPTHGFNFPPVMIRFILRFPRGRGKVVIMNTRAGIKLWKLHLFGISGIAQWFAAAVLTIKGYRVVGMRPVDLPSNWIFLHPGLRPVVVRSLYMRCERNVRRFAKKIVQGGKGYRAMLDIIQDMAVVPIAFGYYVAGRFVLAKSFIASRDCTMCRICVDHCPVHAIRVVDNRPFWTLRCESCMKCINHCPERAIHAAHGLVLGSLYLFFSIIMEATFYRLVNRLPEGALKAILQNGFMELLIGSALLIPFLIVAYRLVHFLMRFRVIERLVIFTSLTLFRWWRRYRPDQILRKDSG